MISQQCDESSESVDIGPLFSYLNEVISPNNGVEAERRLDLIAVAKQLPNGVVFELLDVDERMMMMMAV